MVHAEEKVSTSPAKPRIRHIDAAKGLSIFLVVYWHSVDNRLVLNEALWMLRMPLFFFVSGLFAQSVLDREWGQFLIKKVGNIFYVYVLWTFLVFFTTIFIAQLVKPGPVDLAQPFLLFVEPPRTLWFMYALGICFVLAKLFAPLPRYPILAVAFLLYCVSISSGDWRIIPFPEKIVRLFPFFLLALTVKAQFLGFVERNFRWAWIAFPAFIAAALIAFETPASRIGVVTFGVGALGVTGVVATARVLQENPIVRIAAAIGQRSLLVYVMHRIALFYIENTMEVLGIGKSALTMSLVAILATCLCLVVGELLIRRGHEWMFDAPWLDYKDRLGMRLAR